VNVVKFHKKDDLLIAFIVIVEKKTGSNEPV